VEGKTSQISGNPVTGWIERCALAALSAIPIPQFKVWVKAFFHPAETFDAQKSNISFRRIAIELSIILLICAIFIAIYSVSNNGKHIIDIASLNGVAGIVGLFPILFVEFFVFAGLLYILAKIIGGKGRVGEHTYAIVMVAGALVVLCLLPLLLLYTLNIVIRDAGMAVPHALMVVSMFSIALILLFACICGTYKYLVMMRHVHKLSTIRIALLFITIPVLAVLLIIVWIIYLISTHGIGTIGGMR